MRKFLLAGFAALLFAGCASTTETEVKDNPYRPIADLVIPREIATDEVVVLQGRGFAADCKLAFQLNGSVANGRIEAEVLEVTEQSLTFVTPTSLQLGFYSLVLTQHAKTTTIGGVNVKGSNYKDEDFEMYALAGTNYEIYPVCASKQMRGRKALPNSSASVPNNYSGYAVGTPDGKVYYAGFDMVSGGKQLYKVGCYDSKTAQNMSPVVVEDFFAMGEVDGKFCILKSSDRKSYMLVEWNAGVETLIRTFELTPSGGQRILVPDSRFVYHAATKTILLYGNMGSGDAVGQATFSLDMVSGAANQNGGNSSISFWYASVGEKLFGFGVKIVNEVASTQVYRIDNPQEWNTNGSGATLVATLSGQGFVSPVYSPVTKMVYGLNDYEAPTVLSTFNPETQTFEARRWVNPGVALMLYVPQVLQDDASVE